MVLRGSLKLSRACAGSGASQEVLAKISHLPSSALGPPGRSYKAICRSLLLVLGFEGPQGGQATGEGCC